MSAPVETELHERVAEVTARAGAALGVAAGARDELATVRSLLAAVGDRLAEAGRASAERHATELAGLEARFEERREALARAHAAATGLRGVTSPDAMLAQAPAALCEATGFRRALLSTVRDSAMVPEALHLAGERDREASLLAELRAEPLRLEHPLIETEVLRRRRAMLASPRSASLIGWGVVAPLLSGTAVVGILHADRGPGEALDGIDRDALSEFAAALSHAHESASLRRTLRGEREELKRFLEWLNAQSLALADGPITLSVAGRKTTAMSTLSDPLSEILTRRERDVVRLLAEGGTNRTIADTLVLSETTVKFHVNSILRKLDVANRAEAVARYLALTP